jgi:hypothetical protein
VRSNGGSRDGSGDTGSRAVAVLLACAALVAAAITARAAFLASDASGSWQAASRQEVKRSALALLTFDSAYGTEAPTAFAITVQQTRAEEQRAMAGQQPAELAPGLEAEAQVHDGVVAALRPSSELASNPRYALDGGGYDIVQWLAEERIKSPLDLTIDPDADMAAGDLAADRAIRLMSTTIPVGLAFLFGALAQAFRPARTLLLVLGWASLLVAVLLALALELAT